MAQVERIRTFIAVDLGLEVRAALSATTRELASTGADARWVRAEGMHATLKFLGGVEPKRLDAARNALEPVAAASPAMKLSVRRLGAFPSLRRPRVLWAGIDCPGLADLAARIDAALSPLGFPLEQRSFNPHITLARIRSLRGWTELADAIERHREDTFGDNDVIGVTIYRSTLRPDGAVYDALWTIPLAQHK